MKAIKYLIIASILLATAYFSIEVKALDEVKKSTSAEFDAKSYARQFLKEKITPALSQAISVQDLLQLLQQDPKNAFAKHAHSVAIGNLRNFLVQGEGKVTAVDENSVQLQIAGLTQPLTIATEFIYGNAIRDATGIFDIKNFSNTSDINNIAAELNRIIRTEVVPPFREQVKVDSQVRFTGALELNQARLNLNQLEILPITLQVL